MHHSNNNSHELSADEEEFDMKKWISRMLRIWPWFIFSVVGCILLSVLYLRYAHASYDAVAAVLVKDEKKGAEAMDNSTLKEMGLGGNSKLVENEIEVFKSADLLEDVVNKLQLYIVTTRIGRIKNVDVFDNEIPFKIQIINPQDIKEDDDFEWEIKKSGSGYWFENKDEQIKYSFKFGNAYSSKGIYFICKDNPNYSPDKDVKTGDTLTYAYNLKLSAISETIIEYGKKLSIEQATKLSTVINLEIKDKNENKAKNILQTLIDIYNAKGKEDKNRVTDSTINFLNDRLVSVVNELKLTEGKVENFKTKNKVTDIAVDEQQYMTLAQQVDVQRAQSETQLNIINALEHDLEVNQTNPHLVPSTLGIDEPTLALLIEKHNELILQKERIVQKTGPQNPLLLDIQDQITQIRSKLLSNVKNLKEAYNISLRDVSKKDNKLSGLIQNVPVVERELIQITRNKEVQEQIYSYLLQKREESEVTRASNLEDSRTIAQPRSLGKKWPKKSIVLALGLLLGLIMPICVTYIQSFFNNKIGDIKQIELAIHLPLLGQISHLKKIKSPIVISARSRSIASEQIRNIRTAISFTGKGKEIKTILATSYQPGDGKSFVSLNLAASYAILEKKTIILEFDLRKPHITKHLGLDIKEGISSILSGKASLDDMITEIPGYDGKLNLLSAGYLPPNPAELISSPRMQTLIKDLQNRYDYIIIDTPPFGLVADAALLQQFSDITLIILRQNHTNKEVYAEIKNHLLKHPGYATYIILNGVGKNKRYQERYGSYKYGYAEGYYSNEEV